MITKGEKFSIPFIVNANVYQGFIDLFKDKNPLHTNTDFAIKAGFESCVMHGNILNGFLSYFVGERLPLKNVIIHSQQIDFKNPVYLNDELNFKAEVIEIYESVNVVEIKFYFINKSGQKVAKGKIQIGILV